MVGFVIFRGGDGDGSGCRGNYTLYESVGTGVGEAARGEEFLELGVEVFEGGGALGAEHGGKGE